MRVGTALAAPNTLVTLKTCQHRKGGVLASTLVGLLHQFSASLLSLPSKSALLLKAYRICSTEAAKLIAVTRHTNTD